jgi:hypothetical protein
MDNTLGLRTRSVAFPAIESAMPYVLWLLLVSGLSELILFRTLSRVGVHIPKTGWVLEAFNALVGVGSYAFNVASITVVVALLLLSYAAIRGRFGRHWLTAVTGLALLAFTSASVFLAFTGEDSATRLAYGLASVAIMLAVAGQALTDGDLPFSRRLIIGLIVLAYVLAQYRVLAVQAYDTLGRASGVPGGITLLQIAEALVVLNAGAVFLAWSGIRRRDWPGGTHWLIAGAVVLLFLGSLYGRPDSSTAAILSLWSLGLTLYLPIPMYALALGLYSVALSSRVAAALKNDRVLPDAIALGLLPVAGLTLDLSYQHLVAVLALALLAFGHNGDERPVAVPG